MLSLQAFTCELLRRHDALVEEKEGEIEAILPREVSQRLRVPEHVRLLFFMPAEETNALFVSYDSELFCAMETLVYEKGGFCCVTLPSPSVRPEKLQEKLTRYAALSNAVVHVENGAFAPVAYLLFCVKYKAVSDEEKEGLFFCMVNPLNGFVRRLNMRDDFLQHLEHAVEKDAGSLLKDAQVLYKGVHALCRALNKIIAEETAEFTHSLERRLNRDVARIHDYYQTLTQEAYKRIQKKEFSAEQEEKQRKKCELIHTERRRKIQDMAEKYSLTVTMEPVTCMAVESMAPVFTLKIRRRKAERLLPLSYNPLLRALDELPCESCYYPLGARFVCDEKNHIVCRACFKPCAQCEKEICRACHAAACPKCGRGWEA